MLDFLLAQAMPTASPLHAAIDGVVNASVSHEAWEKPTAIGAVVVGALAAIATGVLAFFTWKLAKETTDLARQSAKATDFEAVREQRAARPVIVGELHIPSGRNVYFVCLVNKGSTAFRVSVSGRDAQGNTFPSASGVFQIIGPNETPIPTALAIYSGGSAKDIRIRYFDAFGNKYITEYRVLDRTLAFPVFRLPWLVGSERPRRWSEEVTWEVEHFERVPGVPDEKLDPTPEDNG